jgi:hypothetical protein
MNLMILIIIVIQNEINLHHQKNVNTLFFYFVVDLEVNFHSKDLIRYLNLFIKNTLLLDWFVIFLKHSKYILLNSYLIIFNYFTLLKS